MKVLQDSYGLDGDQEITALSGKKMSIMEEAIEADFATALVQTGRLTEPGTAVFVASTKARRMREEQAIQIIESGLDVILGAGERYLLPEGVTGRHGDGRREDGVNLIERAKELGYTVVYTCDELLAVRNTDVTRVLGVFAYKTTYNDMTEEELRAEGLPFFVPGSPTIAEMSAAALEILSRNPKAAKRGIFIVAEEEATDNFPSDANARGSFEAGKRADEAFGVFVDFVTNNPNTLLITAADSSAGGKNIVAESPEEMVEDGLLVEGKDGKMVVGEIEINSGPDGEFVLAPLDGVDGASTEPFLAAPDKKGNSWQFAVAWASEGDLSGGTVVRAKGLNAELVSQLGVVDNTDIYRIMYYTLFDRWLGEEAVYEPQVQQTAENQVQQTAENVILLIGDGISFATVTAARIYKVGPDGNLAIDTLDHHGWISTHALNSLVTGSASAGTAIATGQKTNNRLVGMLPDGTELESILDIAQDMGKSTGLVTTSRITHATPAAFGSSSDDRGNWNDIATDYIFESQPDILLGGGLRYWIDDAVPGSSRTMEKLMEQGLTETEALTDYGLLDDARGAGYRIVLTADELAALDIDKLFEDGEKLLGLFALSHLAYELEREVQEPHLATLTDTALDYLSQNEKGFFLMVESARIDHAQHGNAAGKDDL